MVFEWYPTAASGNQFNVSSAGNYVVLVTDTVGCSARDTVVVTTSLADVQLGNDTAFCAGGKSC
ncbi:MAG: hypothetical protein IPM91_10155 [Bacteroidetes bacterium]|nr:hypothetical protein [Bacteroidota bacterium]